MKILFVTLKPIQFNTSATLRNLALIEGLAKLGHQLEILTLPPMENAQWLDESLALPSSCSISYLSVPGAYESVAFKHHGFFGKLKKLLLPILRKIFHSLSIHDFTIISAKQADVRHCASDEYDLIISSSDPKSSHVAVKRLLSRGCKTRRWIQYWGDPLAYDITNKTIWPRSLLRFYEGVVLKNADKVVYVSPFTYRQQSVAFKPLANKFTFIPIPYRKQKIYPIKDEYDYTCSYLGDYYSRSRNILPLAQAIRTLDIPAVFAGNTDTEIKSENITVKNRVSQFEVDQIEHNSKILICLLNCKGNQIPGKLYHYAATNKPILVIIDGDQQEQMRDYLISFERFELCNNTSDEIEVKIRQMSEDHRTYAPNQRLDPVNIANEFLTLVLKEG